ncbi:MAG: hypothetical protein ACXV8J_04210 [Methylobacter sp.]
MHCFRYVALILLSQGLSGCLSPLALDDMSLAYNEATANDLSKQLLLNIARAQHNEPIHFSGISNIAATLNFQATIGATPALTGSNGSAIMPILGVGASENPTISIVPMQGAEFTKRLLTPLTEDQLGLLLRQNVEVDLLLRLAVLEFRTRENGREQVYHNRPRNRENYTLFRRMVLHLSSIQDHDQLYFEPLVFEQHWSLPIKSMTSKDFQVLEKEYTITLDQQQGVYRLDKRTVGRMIITNYDPSLLSEAERHRLNDETELNPPNDLLVDIRPGYPGGEYPMHGKLRLRSFSNILYFIGRTLSAEPEGDISKDPRTPDVSENPPFALAITETDSSPADTDLFVKYKDKYYAVYSDPNYPWNKNAFRVLSQMFQMTMSELPKVAAPSITISK